MIRSTRPVSWIKAALREFETFPDGVRSTCLTALTIAAEGGKADIAKPMRGLGSGGSRLPCHFAVTRSAWSMRCSSVKTFWVVHVFQKKSTRGIKTPKAEIDLVKDRMKRLKEMLR